MRRVDRALSELVLIHHRRELIHQLKILKISRLSLSLSRALSHAND